MEHPAANKRNGGISGKLYSKEMAISVKNVEQQKNWRPITSSLAAEM